MMEVIGTGLGSPDLWLVPSLILAALGILITFNTKFRAMIGTRISLVERDGGLFGILLMSLAIFISSSRAFFFRRKMQSDLIGTYGCERSQFYDCRDLIFASSLPITTIWLATAAIIIWFIITIVRDHQDNLAVAVRTILPFALFAVAALSILLLIINYISNGFVLAPYSLTNITLIGISGWMFRVQVPDDDTS